MSDAVAKTPTLDEQMAEFKGFTSVDGAVRPETDAERGVTPAARTEPAPKSTGSAQERLTAAFNAGKKPAAAAATDDDDDGDGYGDEGAGTGEAGEQQTQQAQQQQQKADPQKRINQAIKRQRAAERERDALRAETRTLSDRLARLEGAMSTGARTAPLTAAQSGGNNANTETAPDPSKYQYGDLDTRYIADVARFEARQTLRAEQAQQQRQTQSAKDAEAEAEKAESLRNFAAKGSERYEDFDEVVIASSQANEWPMSNTLGELVVGSDHGPDIAYFLASHQDEARRDRKSVV